MRILLTNDDGVNAPGLLALVPGLAARGRVVVMAPRAEQSGIGHAITYRSPIAVERVRVDGCAEAYAVDGTPADCVKFALLEGLPQRPDLVVSGINLGLNLGYNIFYSGTVAAAIEGAMYGVPSVAFSTCQGNADKLPRVAEQALRVLDLLLERGSDAALAYNVNVPTLCDGEPDVAFTHHRDSAFRECYVRRQRGAELVYQLNLSAGEQETAGGQCDEHVVGRGMISITPLRASLTDHDSLERLFRERPPRV